MSGRGGLKQAFASQGCSLAIFGYRKGVRERSLDVAAVRGQLSSGHVSFRFPLRRAPGCVSLARRHPSQCDTAFLHNI